MPNDPKLRGTVPLPSSNSGEDRQTMTTHASSADQSITIDEPTQALIGHRLKAVYAEIVEQPVPERLLRLLEELERKEQE